MILNKYHCICYKIYFYNILSTVNINAFTYILGLHTLTKKYISKCIV